MDFTTILKFLLPFLLKYGPEWVMKFFPSLPEWAKLILKDLAEELAGASTKEQKKAARKKAASRCKLGSGVGCPSDTVGLG